MHSCLLVSNRRTYGISNGPTKGLTKGLTKDLSKGLIKGLTKDLSKGLIKGLTKDLSKGLIKGLTKDLSKGLIKGLTNSQTKSYPSSSHERVERRHNTGNSRHWRWHHVGYGILRCYPRIGIVMLVWARLCSTV